MDVNALLKEAKARFSHESAKQYLTEKYKNQLTIVNQGGMWKVSLELIGFLKNAPETVVLLDIYDNPLRINSKELLSNAENIFYTVMNNWHDEWSMLSKNR